MLPCKSSQRPRWRCPRFPARPWRLHIAGQQEIITWYMTQRLKKEARTQALPSCHKNSWLLVGSFWLGVKSDKSRIISSMNWSNRGDETITFFQSICKTMGNGRKHTERQTWDTGEKDRERNRNEVRQRKRPRDHSHKRKCISNASSLSLKW